VVGYIQEKLFALFFGDAYHPSLIVTKKDENLHMPRRAPAWLKFPQFDPHNNENTRSAQSH
jgi:hypothetical protein